MIIIACVDDNLGMMFNHRRISQDSVIRERILKIVRSNRLWLSKYSQKQFEGISAPQINVADSFLSEAEADEYCFVEDKDILPYSRWISKIILFRWNRKYPADQFFPIDLASGEWKLTSVKDFIGTSHDKITEEVYEK